MVICPIVAYTIGVVSFAYIAGRTLKCIDIRDYGSGKSVRCICPASKRGISSEASDYPPLLQMCERREMA